MGVLRTLLQVFGAILVISGFFFALQGAGVIMWPAESFMLANSQWVTNGSIIALVGVGMFVLGRRLAR